MSKLNLQELENIDAAVISRLILNRLDIKYSSSQTDKLGQEENPKLRAVLNSLEETEDDWSLTKQSEEHTFGRKESGEVIKLWSVPQKSAQVLKDLVILTDAKTVLEVGTSAGYAAIHLAAGAKINGGKVYTIEILKEKIDLANSNFTKSGLDNITLIKGEALEILKKWNYGTIDFVFLDADKENYGKYLDLLVPLLKIGGIIVADNINDYGHMMKDYLQKVSGTHLPQSRTDHRVMSYYLAALDNGLMITKKISD